jgi:hypothetical protein
MSKYFTLQIIAVNGGANVCTAAGLKAARYVGQEKESL